MKYIKLSLPEETPDRVETLPEVNGVQITYVGQAQPGTKLESEAGWRICRYRTTTEADGKETIERDWADGTWNYIKKWTDRATYNYKLAV